MSSMANNVMFGRNVTSEPVAPNTVDRDDIYGDACKRKGQNINNLLIDDRVRHRWTSPSPMAASCLVEASPEASNQDERASANTWAANDCRRGQPRLCLLTPAT